MPGLHRPSRGSRGNPVVVYCAAGARAARAVQLLKGAGWAEVYNAGGFRNMPR